MKKFLAIMLALVMVLGLAACGSTKDDGKVKATVFWYDYKDIYGARCSAENGRH